MPADVHVSIHTASLLREQVHVHVARLYVVRSMSLVAALLLLAAISAPGRADSVLENNPFRMRHLFKAEMGIRDIMEEVRAWMEEEKYSPIWNQVTWYEE